jgi:hypothetical protein
MSDEKDFLLEVGTRYNHWSELLEEFRAGVVVLDTIKPQYVSKADVVKRGSLVDAIQLIEKQLDRHSNMDKKVWDMGRQINAIPKAEVK